MPVLLNYPLFHADDDNGAPLTGGLLYSYVAGTSTAKATYTTRAMGTANTNPVVLDSRGEAIIYGSGLYKLILKTSAGVTIWTQDNVEMGPGQGAYSFYVDPSETDQGTTGLGASLYDILTALGTSKKATVYFPHSGTDDTTTYTVSTTFDMTSYDNVIFDIENGARLTVGAGLTLTFPSPGNIRSGNYQIFAGTGTIAYATNEGIRYGLWDGTLTSGEIGINAAPSSGAELVTGDVKATSLVLAAGATVTELSIDGTMGGNSDTAVPTEQAVKTYVDAVEGILYNIQTYTASDTWTKPTGLAFVVVEVIGGGGGGGGCSTTGAGEASVSVGGAGGGYSRKKILTASLGATETVTVGTGGAGGSVGENAGTAGGTSSFGAHCSATGGAGGTGGPDTVSNTTATGVAGGVGSSGDVNWYGGDSGPKSTAAGGLRPGLGFGGGTVYAGITRPNASGTGYSGKTPGGGGGPTSCGESTAGRAGGAGADGVVIVWEYK